MSTVTPFQVWIVYTYYNMGVELPQRKNEGIREKKTALKLWRCISLKESTYKRKQSASNTACALYCTSTIHNKSKRKHCLSVWNVLSQVLTCDPLLCFTCFSSPKSTSFSSFDWPGPAGRESLEDVSR